MTIMQWVLAIVAGAYFGLGALIGLVAGLMNAWASRGYAQPYDCGHNWYIPGVGESWLQRHPRFNLSRRRAIKRVHRDYYARNSDWPRGAPRE